VDDASAQSNSTPPRDQPGSEPPGLRAQLFATIDAGKRLLTAHVNLAKAELGEIAGNVGRMVGLFGAAIGIALLAGLLFGIGLFLFLGEWLFGSIGWGMLLGTILLLDLALVLVLVALDVSGRRVATSFVIAALVGIGVGVVFGLDVPHQGWRALGDTVAAAAIPDEGFRTTIVAVITIAALAGIVAFLGAIRGGIGGAVVAFVVAAIFGAILGWITSVQVAGQVGAALGTLVALILWPILSGLDVARKGIDGEALQKKFVPEQTIELTKETIEWVRKRTPLVPKS